MPIKGFRKKTKLKPLVDVRIGANVPVGCKNHSCYADSEDGNRCVDYEGTCSFVTKCKMARRDEADVKTRPAQLPYFKMPSEFRQQLKLPPRPTIIPNICVNSSWNVEQNGMVEPVEVISDYPIMDHGLYWWNATECVCKGNGEIAHLYPFSPANKRHMQPRECIYRDCPDYGKNEGRKYSQCKAVGELYFRVPGTAGYPCFWRFTTRSTPSIETMIMEMEQIHTASGGVISRLPLNLVLKKEKASYVDDDGKSRKTKVNRAHIVSAITMEEMFAFRNKVRIQLLNDGVKMIAASTPDVAPRPAIPVEQQATAPQEDWNDETAKEPIASQKPKPAPKPAPAAKPAPKPAATKDDPNIERHKAAQTLEAYVITAMRACRDRGELAACMAKNKQAFVPYKDLDYPKKAGKVYNELKASLPVKSPVPPQQEEAPDPEPPTDVKKQAPASSAPAPDGKLGNAQAVIREYSEQTPPVFTQKACIDMINEFRKSQNNQEVVKSIADFTLEECQTLEEMASGE